MVFKKGINKRKLVSGSSLNALKMTEGTWYHQVERHPSCFCTVWLLQVCMWMEESRVAALQNPDTQTPHENLQLMHKHSKCSGIIASGCSYYVHSFHLCTQTLGIRGSAAGNQSYW